MLVWNDGGADGGILVKGAVVFQNKIGHGPVVTEGGLVAQKPLIQPFLPVGKNKLPAVAGQGTGQTGNRVKQRFRGFHDSEGDVIPHRLHPGQGVGVGVGHIGSSGHTAHFGILEGLYQVHNGVRVQEAVRVHKDHQFSFGNVRTPAEGGPLAPVFLLNQIG